MGNGEAINKCALARGKCGIGNEIFCLFCSVELDSVLAQ